MESNQQATGQTPDKASRKRKRKRPWWRRILRWFFFFLAFVVSLPFLLILGWQVSPVRSGLASIGLSIAGGFLDGKVEAQLGGTLVGGIALYNVRWFDRKGRLMAGFKRLEVEYDLLHFIQSGFVDLQVGKVELEKIEGALRFDKKGKMNILDHLKLGPPGPKPPPPPPKTGPPSKFRIFVKRIAIDGIKFEMHQKGELFIKLDDFGLKTQVELKGDKLYARGLKIDRLVAAMYQQGKRFLHVKDFHLAFEYFMNLTTSKMKGELKDLRLLSSSPIDPKNPPIPLRKLALKFAMDLNKQKVSIEQLDLQLAKESRISSEKIDLLLVPTTFDIPALKLFLPASDIRSIVPAVPLKPDFDATITVKGPLTDLKLKLLARLGEFGLNLKAGLGLLTQAYDLDLSATNANGAELLGNPALKSKASLTLKVKGKGFDPNKLNAKIKLKVLPGYFQKYRFHQVLFHGLMQDGILQIQHLRARTPYARLSADGKVEVLKGRYDIKLAGVAPSLRTIGRVIGQRMKGSASFNVRAIGENWMPRASVDLRVKKFSHPSAYVHSIGLKARLRKVSPLHAVVDSLNVRYAKAAGQTIRYVKLGAYVRMPGGTIIAGVKPLRIGIGKKRYALRGDVAIRLKGNHLQVNTLNLRRKGQSIDIKGFFNLKGRGQNVRVRFKRFDVGALVRAMGIMPRKYIEGHVGMDLTFAGNFRKPRVKLKLNMKKARYDGFNNINTDIDLSYKARTLRIKKLHVSRYGKPLVGLDAKIPIHIALDKFPKQPVPVHRRIDIKLDVPKLSLTWLGKQLKLPLKGTLKTHLRISRSLSDPRLYAKIALIRGGWEDYKYFDLNLFVRYRRGKLELPRVDDKQQADWMAGVTKRTSWLQRAPNQVNWLARGGRRLVELGGDLPLTFRLYERRGKLKQQLSLANKPLRFLAKLHRQKFKDMLNLIITDKRKKLIKQAGKLLKKASDYYNKADEQLKGSAKQKALIFRSRMMIAFTEKLLDQLDPPPAEKKTKTKRRKSKRKSRRKGKRASDKRKKEKKKEEQPKRTRPVPISKAKVKPSELLDDTQARVAWLADRLKGLKNRIAMLSHLRGEYEGYIRLHGPPTKPQLDLLFAVHDASFCPWQNGKPVCWKKRSSYYKNTKGRSLRVKKVNFLLGVLYRPKGVALTLAEHLQKRLNLNLNRKFSPSTGRLVLKTKLDVERYKIFRIQRTQLALDIKINPKTLGFSYRLHDPIELHVAIPRLSFPRLARFYRHPVLRKLRGYVNFKLDISNRFSKPQLDMHFALHKGAFLWGKDEDDRLLWLDGLGVNVDLALKNGELNLTDTVKVLNRPLLENRVKVDLLASMNPKNFKVTFKPGQRIDALLLFKDYNLLRFEKLGGFYKSIKGTLRGRIHVKGNFACPRFSGPNFIAVDNGSLGRVSKTVKARLLAIAKRKGIKSKILPILRFTTLRFDLETLTDGRTYLKLKLVRRIWHALFKKWRNKPAIRGFIKAPLPLGWGTLPRKDAQRICGWPGGKMPKDLDVNIAANTGGVPLDFLETFVPGLSMDGKFDTSINIDGTLKAPKIKSGRVGIEIYKMQYPQYGVDIRKARCRRRRGSAGTTVMDCKRSYFYVYLKPKAYRVEGRLQGRVGEPLRFDGNISHKDFIPKLINLAIKSNGFKPMATPRYRLNLRTDIKIAGTLGGPNITGSIVIPSMLFTLPESSHKPGDYSEDQEIIVLGEKSEKKLYKNKGNDEFDELLAQKSSLDKTFVDLKIVIPRNFWVKNRDLSIEAKTDDFQNLRVLLQRGRLKITGGIEIVKGELQAYGKRFRVRSGSKVSFTGQSVRISNAGGINPKLDVTAGYVVTVAKGSQMAKKGHNKVVVLLKVSGSAYSPVIDFEVRNARTNARIMLDKINAISLILTGSTTNDLSQGQQQNLANQAVGLVGRMVSNELKNALSGVVPLDVLKLETGTRLQDLQVEFGWYLTPELYTEFALKPVPLEEESLWEARLNWAINRNWAAELRAGQVKINDDLLFRTSGHIYFRIKLK